MLKLAAVAEWGGRAADADQVAEAVARMLAAVPVPPGVQRRDWFDLHDRTPFPTEHEASVARVERRRERGPDGTAQPLAGFRIDLVQGRDGTAADDSVPFMTIAVMAGVVIGGPRMPANTVRVSASAGWMQAAIRPDRVTLVRALAEAWDPARAATWDRDVTRRLPRLPPRTPWTGYASCLADAIVPRPVFSAAFTTSRFARGALAVLDGPWEASRVVEEVPRFLEASTWQPIPQEESGSAAT